MKKLHSNMSLATLVAIASTFSVTHAQADAGYGASENLASGGNILVGVTAASSGRGHPSPGGEPGIGHSGVYGGTKVSFAGLQTPQRAAPNAQGVSVITAAPASHRNMGSFNFAKVADADIYYGEWAAGTDFSADSHTVYYAGKEITSDMPSEGTAQYNIAALSQYNSGDQISGIFDADFDTNKLTGTLSTAALNYTIDSNIVGAEFDGSASVSAIGADTDTPAIAGTAKGHFFGEDAQHLGGFAEFTNDKAKNIAFAGSKS